MKKILSLILILLPLFCLAQNKEKAVIHIIHADKAAFDEKIGRDVQRLLGNVALRHDSVYFYSDSAYLYEKSQTFKGYGQVHVTMDEGYELFGDSLVYNGETKFLEVFKHVVLRNDSMTLRTNYLTYDRINHVASYPNNGKIISGNKVMTSKKGYYFDEEHLFKFRYSVVATMPEYELYTDSLDYDNGIEKFYFEGPTTIINKENTMKGSSGYYDMRRDFIYIRRDAHYFNREQSMVSDTMIYSKHQQKALALSNVVMLDTTHKTIIYGDRAELFQDKGFGYVTDKMRTLYYAQKDTLFLHADSLFFYFDTATRDMRRFVYFHDVSFFRNDVQGICDTLNYTLSDSLILMRHNPILWAENSQLRGDLIDIAISDGIDSAMLRPNAFIIQKDTIDGFNQIKGKRMTAFFKENSLQHVYNNGNAETIYFLRQDDGKMIGINMSKSVAMDIKIDNNTISRIKYFKKTDETLYPEKDLKEEYRFLKGFEWLEELRPTRIEN